MTAVVTGGAMGIGAAICAQLQREQWSVSAGDLPGAFDHSDLPAEVTRLELDVRDRASIDRAIQHVISQAGRIDLFVNNAGIAARGPLETFPEAEWLALLEVNLHGVFRGVQAAGQRMLEQRSGAIVNVASVAWTRGAGGRAAYAAAKAAVVSLTQTAAVEWSGRGVRVNAIAPGYVLTDHNREAFESGAIDRAATLARIPMSRFGALKEIAAAVAFLASPAASYINGHVLVADGGFLADYGVPFDG